MVRTKAKREVRSPTWKADVWTGTECWCWTWILSCWMFYRNVHKSKLVRCGFYLNVKRHLGKSDLSTYSDIRHVHLPSHLHNKMHVSKRLRCQGTQWRYCTADVRLQFICLKCIISSCLGKVSVFTYGPSVYGRMCSGMSEDQHSLYLVLQCWIAAPIMPSWRQTDPNDPVISFHRSAAGLFMTCLCGCSHPTPLIFTACVNSRHPHKTGSVHSNVLGSLCVCLCVWVQWWSDNPRSMTDNV